MNIRPIVLVALGALMLSCSQATAHHSPAADSADLNAATSAEVPFKADDTPIFVKALMEAYPDQVLDFRNDSLILANGKALPYDDGISRSWEEKLTSGDIEDMSFWVYTDTVGHFCDPGRIRNEAFFKAMYGTTQQQVSSHLVSVKWCPTLVGQTLRMTNVNHAADQLRKVSEELDAHPEYKQYLKSAGTMNWRVVAGTNRLSPHSFGIAIDIAVPSSNYWRWDNKNAKESAEFTYRNRIPLAIVAIFERHGFIWGGRWYHYDTMHFEYRPEMLIYRDLLKKA